MYNWKKLDKYQKITLIFFGVLAGILLVKFVLITTFTVSVDEFLSTYPYYNSDSFDWVANGMRLFENSSISFRNPGLVLAIKALVAVSALYLLPLLNQL